MNIKKILSLFLSVSIMILFTAPLSAESSNEDKSLYNFLKTTENITTSYKYPSMNRHYTFYLFFSYLHFI